MDTIEYRDIIDKSSWGNGEWQDEPDKLQWQDEATGLPCLIVRNAHLGNLCGYCGITASHPWFGWDSSRIEDKVSVYGGVNFSDRCQPEELNQVRVCHVVEPGEDDDVWWIGFHCGFSVDVMPAINFDFFANSTYKNIAFVKEQCLLLAAQLAAVSQEEPPKL